MNARIIKTLKTAGIAPVDVDSESLECIDGSGCLTPWLRLNWKRNGSKSDTEIWSRPEHELYLVDEAHGRRGVFDLLGTRLIWLPERAKSGLLGIVSSRLGRDLHAKSAWFRSLRAACVQGTQRRELLIAAPRTTTYRFARRCHELFGIDFVDLEVSDAVNLSEWFHYLVSPTEGKSLASIVSVSPQIITDTSTPLPDVPVSDRCVAALADRLIALTVRAGGNWDRLIRWRLGSDHYQAGHTLLALGNNLVADGLRDEMLRCGAVGWAIWPNSNSETAQTMANPEATSSSTAARDLHDLISTAVPVPSARPVGRPTTPDFPESLPVGDFLTHCTRRRDGPWPDQDEENYLDDLILNRKDGDHSALAALGRIITMRRLVASNESIRGQTPVVSFTEVPLDELHQLRVFRPHRGRWDFEPYGICVRREWIHNCGGRPVQYASRDVWDSLSVSERLYYQLDLSVTKAGKEIDWTVEQEWRVIGDLMLDTLPSQDAFIFVPNEKEAAELEKVSPWPVIALSSWLLDDGKDSRS